MSEIVYHTPKTTVSVGQKLNPLWWFRNDYEQQLPDWYQPEWQPWRRYFYWNYLRNPLQNVRCCGSWYAFAMVNALFLTLCPPLMPLSLFFIGGVSDRAYMVEGKVPVWTVQRDDLDPPELGWQWSIIHIGLGLPFVSYSGHRVVCYLGWQPSGIFGAKFNIRERPL